MTGGWCKRHCFTYIIGDVSHVFCVGVVWKSGIKGFFGESDGKIYGIIFPIHELVFFKMVKTTNQILV